ncbi:hypothetical protein EDF24_3704 [Curtobacterium sp. PhB130]|nr:hypothetical protein EDF24_3704 [Curtobacterium sp. PhB130]TCK58241.1 hypothetical protein EDF27_3852 [Curtobacterium sp. PhB136]
MGQCQYAPGRVSPTYFRVVGNYMDCINMKGFCPRSESIQSNLNVSVPLRPRNETDAPVAKLEHPVDSIPHRFGIVSPNCRKWTSRGRVSNHDSGNTERGEKGNAVIVVSEICEEYRAHHATTRPALVRCALVGFACDHLQDNGYSRETEHTLQSSKELLIEQL